MADLVARLAGVAMVVAQAGASPAVENPAPLYALAAAIVSLAAALGLVGKWMMAEITRLNNALISEAVPAMKASTIATNNMTELARQLSGALTDGEREKVRLELELEQVRRRRHPEGE